MLKTIVALILGGSFGAISRWGLHIWIDNKTSQTPFPWGILTVNTVGCFLFGFLFALAESKGWFSEVTRLAIFTGFLGSFTTFSTFSWNTLSLLRDGQAGLAAGNIGASVCLSMLGVWLGFVLAKAL
ncbi:fluoride efflux transporter CrcB [Verrucomicrobiales bacterium]|jgi:fluoride exporter|nr:fluoride efflux transporter CrcB [Verrucomicrobiales bacterium]